MSDQYIAKYCAPTLAGLKTGSLFTAACTDRNAFARELRELNGVLTRHGLRAIPLRYSDRRALIYLYRPEALTRDLRMPEAAELLRESDEALRSLYRLARYGGAEPSEAEAEAAEAALVRLLREENLRSGQEEKQP